MCRGVAAVTRAFHRWFLPDFHGEYRIMEPSIIWTLVVLIGFIGWVGSTFGFIFQGITRDNRLEKKKAFRWGILIIISYALWVIGLYFA